MLAELIVDAESGASAIVALGQTVIDQQGRRWLTLGSRGRGFTRGVGGRWFYGGRFITHSMHAWVEVTSPTMVEALELWELPHVEVDGDPTCAAGVYREVAS